MASPVSLTAGGIQLVVFDMAGTTVDEGGVVYVTLQNVLRGYGISFTEAEFNVFHGANKREVIAYVPRGRGRAGETQRGRARRRARRVRRERGGERAGRQGELSADPLRMRSRGSFAPGCPRALSFARPLVPCLLPRPLPAFPALFLPALFLALLALTPVFELRTF